MSVYEAVDGVYRKYNHWPDPFRNLVKRIDVLACEDTWQAKVEMYGIGFGQWAFSSFIPSPVELTRKTITGGYKCGFYFKTKIKSPLDIIWADESVSTMLMEIARPFVTTLFLIWGISTAVEALSTWSTIIYAGQKCGATTNEILWDSGVAVMPLGHTEGSAGFFHILWDPHNRAEPNTGQAIMLVEDHTVTLDAFIKISSGSRTLTNVSVWLPDVNNVSIRNSEVFIGTMAPGAERSVHLRWEEVRHAGRIYSPWLECDTSAGPVTPFAQFQVVRFTATVVPTSEGKETHPLAWNPHPWQPKC